MDEFRDNPAVDESTDDTIAYGFIDDSAVDDLTHERGSCMTVEHCIMMLVITNDFSII